MNASVDYMSFSMESMTGTNQPRSASKDSDVKVVIKNTFLEVYRGNLQISEYGARRRASSDSQFPQKLMLPNLNCEEDTGSNSTPSLVDESLYSITPRTSSPLSMNTDSSLLSPEKLPSSLPGSFTQDSDEDQQKHQEYSDLCASTYSSYSTPVEILDMLEKLTQMVGIERYKREDLVSHELTPVLYPYIPLEEGNITSLGSILHLEGNCKPCAFLKKDRCHKKDLCLYCHFAHNITAPKSSCFRKSKKKRMRQARQRPWGQESGDDQGYAAVHVSL